MALEQKTLTWPTITIVGPFTVYKCDVSSAARSQGGLLDLHQGSRQEALKVTGLTAEFKWFAQNEGQDICIVSKYCVLWLNEMHNDLADSNTTQPEIDHVDLCHILLQLIDLSWIKWGCALLAIEPVLGTLQHTLMFKDGSSMMADLVVGADGAWSCVCLLVSPHKPTYTGLTFIELHLTEVSTKHPEVTALVGRGSLFV
jgi:2-polyprenyl-6-methoxyphenol hydroxylase-like FAD-dependent oxidoreductase